MQEATPSFGKSRSNRFADQLHCVRRRPKTNTRRLVRISARPRISRSSASVAVFGSWTLVGAGAVPARCGVAERATIGSAALAIRVRAGVSVRSARRSCGGWTSIGRISGAARIPTDR